MDRDVGDLVKVSSRIESSTTAAQSGVSSKILSILKSKIAQTRRLAKYLLEIQLASLIRGRILNPRADANSSFSS